MLLQSTIRLHELSLKLDEENICSYDDILRNKEYIKSRINGEEYLDLLRYDIRYFLNIFFRGNHYYKQVLVEMLYKDITTCFPMYIMSIYFDKPEAYRNLPIYLKTAIDKLGLDEYKDVPLEYIEKIVKTEFKTEGGTYKDGHPLCEISKKPIKYEYDSHDYHYEGPNNIDDINDRFIWSEHRTCDDEDKYLRQIGYPNQVVWASRYGGDGYGFDVLSYDPETRREKLIEVKAWKSEYFEMTDHEIEVMQEAHKYNADYYVYKYTVNETTNSLIKLKYDKDLNELIDIENEIHYEFGNRFPSRVKRDGTIVFVTGIVKKEPEKQKTLTQ